MNYRSYLRLISQKSNIEKQISKFEAKGLLNPKEADEYIDLINSRSKIRGQKLYEHIYQYYQDLVLDIHSRNQGVVARDLGITASKLSHILSLLKGLPTHYLITHNDEKIYSYTGEPSPLTLVNYSKKIIKDTQEKSQQIVAKDLNMTPIKLSNILPMLKVLVEKQERDEEQKRREHIYKHGTQREIQALMLEEAEEYDKANKTGDYR